MSGKFNQRCNALIEAGSWLDQRGLVPATSGNLSARVEEGQFAITASGVHKGCLQSSDILLVNNQGKPLAERQPSAETLLHMQLYEVFAQVQFVLHVHSLLATVLSRVSADNLQLSGYELLKAFNGIDTHDTTVTIPIFENDQDIARLAGQLAPQIATIGPCCTYIIRSHGYYTWGENLQDVLRHIEALEYLFQCELQLRRIE